MIQKVYRLRHSGIKTQPVSTAGQLYKLLGHDKQNKQKPGPEESDLEHSIISKRVVNLEH